MNRFILHLFVVSALSSCAHYKIHKSKENSREMQTVVESYYKTYNDRDIKGQTALMTDNITYISNSGKLRQGKEAYQKYTEGLFKEINEKAVDMTYYVDPIKSVVVATGNAIGTYEESSAGLPPAKGQKYTLPFVEIFEIQDEKIKKFTTFYNEDLFKQQISAK